MAFAGTFQFVAGDEGGLNRFLLDHYVEHQLFYKTLLGQSPPKTTTNLPIQRLVSWPEWLAAHQAMSQSVWTALGGGASTDFSRLDWKDPNALQDWLNVHALWHQSVRESLGLTP